ncbi:MAG: T9SS type A sorting domain-containing protein [Saprospiraceae bacterium]
MNLGYYSETEDFNYFSPTFGDLDNDGDDDIIVGTHTGSLIYIENQTQNGITSYGEPVFDYMDIKINSGALPILKDLNGDGLLDILVGGDQDFHDPLYFYGSLVLYENKGTAESPIFSSTPDNKNFGKIRSEDNTSRYSQTYVSFYDDNDDNLMFTGLSNGFINVYDDYTLGIIDSLIPQYKHYNDIDMGTSATPTIADIDNDGYLEMLIGCGRGGLEFWKTDFKISQGTATNEINNTSNIIYYPNPVKDFLHIETDDNKDPFISLSIMDNLGRIIKQYNDTGNETTIDTKTLPIGTYFLKIQFKEKYKTIKIIKLKN